MAIATPALRPFPEPPLRRCGRRCAALLLIAAAPLAAQDTLVVRADNAPVWGTSVRLVEEMRLGTLDGPEHTSFGDITGVALDGEGRIWIADRLAATIRRFLPDGTWVDDVGRPGAGPGEFDGGYGISLARLPDGRILAYDPLQQGAPLSTFAPDGTFLARVPMVLGAIQGGGFQLRADTAGVAWILSSRSVGRPTRGTSGEVVGGSRQRVWVRLDPGLGVRDTVPIPFIDRESDGGRSWPFGPMAPYTARTVSALSPHGYVVEARTDRYALHRPLRDGRILRIERPHDPVPARREEREQYRRQLAAYARHSGRTPLNTVDIPAVKPAFWAIQVDDDARIWVARHGPGVFREEDDAERERRENPELPVAVGPALEWEEPLVTDVIDPEGRFLGTLRFPEPRSTLAATSGRTVWVIEQGRFDEQYLVRYRIQPGS